MFGRQTVEFSVKGPVSLILDEEQVALPGCSILDINFNRPSQIGELVFRNYYTAWISVLVRYDGPTANPKETGWKVAITKKVLMMSPHHENGSQDAISVAATESMLKWRKVVGMRLILRQPSPEWRVFHVEELNVFGDLPRLAPTAMNTPFEKYDKILELVRQQTLKALHWTPPQQTESNRQENSSVIPKITSSAYEITKLPQT
ncbi:nicolin-1-like [Macrosteles quadrilineatus]|uniref:nicolin-1-like n=1 Tax=Macrosteles quadrilineatus TaxID=74068 RepID=UPI0023E10E2F|nr:nicolin-1-like [Macrosteles quadrilineatus]